MEAARTSVRKFRRWDATTTFSLSTENLTNLNKIVPVTQYGPHRDYTSTPYTSRPIAFSKHQRNVLPQVRNFDAIKRTPPKGLVFVWPQKKRCRRDEYTVYMKMVSHFFYWWDLLGLFPRGTGVPTKKPPWEIAKPLPKPENRDFIIEPDWNSIYAES